MNISTFQLSLCALLFASLIGCSDKSSSPGEASVVAASEAAAVATTAAAEPGLTIEEATKVIRARSGFLSSKDETVTIGLPYPVNSNAGSPPSITLPAGTLLYPVRVTRIIDEHSHFEAIRGKRYHVDFIFYRDSFGTWSIFPSDFLLLEE